MSNSDEDSVCRSVPSARRRYGRWFTKPFPEPMKKLSTMQNTYIYQDLAYHDDIRILKIMRGNQAAPLKCMLLPSALPAINGRPSSSTSKMNEYFALSYCWGREDPTHPIAMYDEQLQKLTLSNSVFYIQDNVAAALRHFRCEDADVNIWIDALCINQANDDEKTAQVSRMHEIYSMADYVCSWLGAGKPETRETFQFLNMILTLERLDKLIDSEQGLESWMLVLQLLRHPWFRRRWVIQELVLAQRAIVHWGEECIEWSDFADAISLFMAKYEEVRKLLGRRRSFSNDRLDPRDIVVNTLIDVTSN
ncbi:heterokaryon incompatibility protein-domain-containing protein [Leptodontidium sp. MPI-SDFR-AT-0119]|nr:heterokaryon incompatibility protein-domain-containing protein [Leptodontidium sp. MPI-SDFR-AT-0119]